MLQSLEIQVLRPSDETMLEQVRHAALSIFFEDRTGSCEVDIVFNLEAIGRVREQVEVRGNLGVLEFVVLCHKAILLQSRHRISTRNTSKVTKMLLYETNRIVYHETVIQSPEIARVEYVELCTEERAVAGANALIDDLDRGRSSLSRSPEMFKRYESTLIGNNDEYDIIQSLYLGLKPAAEIEFSTAANLLGTPVQERFTLVSHSVGSILYDPVSVQHVIELYPEHFTVAGKPMSVEDAIACMSDRKDFDSHVRTGLLLGYPYESVIRFAEMQDLRMKIGRLLLNKTSELRRDSDKRSIPDKIVHYFNDGENLDGYGPVFNGTGRQLSADEKATWVQYLHEALTEFAIEDIDEYLQLRNIYVGGNYVIDNPNAEYVQKYIRRMIRIREASGIDEKIRKYESKKTSIFRRIWW